MEQQQIRLANTILKEKNIAERLMLLNFKTYYKATAIKMVFIGERIDKLINGTEEGVQKLSHINVVNWSLTKKQRQYCGAKIIFSTNDAHVKKMNLDADLTFFTKINLE